MKSAIHLIIALTALGPSYATANIGRLDGATGHVFKFDTVKKTFELLKETEYDPKSETACSRFTVHWTDETEVKKITSPPSFVGIAPQTLATFQGIDDKNTEALAEGKPIIVGMATLYSTEDVAVGKKSGALRSISGRFTPHPGEAPLSGVLEINGKSVIISLRPKVGTITLHEEASPVDLAKGFWQATIFGEEVAGRFITRSMEVTPLPDPLATDDPKLPRVLIIGDSISMNYFDAAKEELKGVANIHRNEGNAGPSSRGVLSAELWLGNHEEKGRHWDVIQFNHGLHDLKQAYDAKSDTWGAYSVPIEDYKANLEKEIAILKKTGAKLIWCSTTPVPNSNKGEYARRKGACEDFNEIALEVMAKHPEIQINDLHASVTNSPVFDDWRKTIDVHFYKAQETRELGKAVAGAIRKALAE